MGEVLQHTLLCIPVIIFDTYISQVMLGGCQVHYPVDKRFSSSSSLCNHFRPRSHPAFAAVWNCSLAISTGSITGLSLLFLPFFAKEFIFELNFIRDSGISTPETMPVRTVTCHLAKNPTMCNHKCDVDVKQVQALQLIFLNSRIIT